MWLGWVNRALACHKFKARNPFWCRHDANTERSPADIPFPVAQLRSAAACQCCDVARSKLDKLVLCCNFGAVRTRWNECLLVFQSETQEFCCISGYNWTLGCLLVRSSRTCHCRTSVSGPQTWRFLRGQAMSSHTFKSFNAVHIWLFPAGGQRSWWPMLLISMASSSWCKALMNSDELICLGIL